MIAVLPSCRLAVLSLSLLACGAGRTGGSAVTRDSAGIAIVDNTGPKWGGAEAWTVVDTAVLDIGGNDADPLYDLGQVGSAARLADGQIVVANGATSEIRYYGADGRHLATSGGKGSGPGEYQSISGMMTGPGDSLLVFDVFARRITVLTSDGKVGRTFSLGGQSGMTLPTDGRMSLAIPAGWFSGGSVLGVVQGFRINDPRSGSYRDTVAYLRYAADGAAQDTVARLPGVEMEQMSLNFAGQTFSSPAVVPLGRTTSTAVHGERLYVAQNDHYEIAVRDQTGRLERLIRVAAEPAPITEEDKTAHRREQLEQMEGAPGMGMVPEQLKAQMRTRVEQASYPATFPFVAELHPDPDGNLWVEEVQRPGGETRRYAVFDPEGVLLGRVILPPRFRPTWVGRDEIVGVWRDADDVEHVRVYPIRKP